MKTEKPFSPVSLFFGAEDYLIEQDIRKLLDETLSEKEKGMNFHLFSAEEHAVQEIIQAAQTFPMFSKLRFVLVKEADHFTEEAMETWGKYVQDPSPTTCLVLRAHALGPWKKHRSQIEKIGHVVEYSRLKGRGLVSWLKNRMVNKGKTLSEEAADYLVAVAGDQLQYLENALEKASLGVGEKKIVELSDVEGSVSDVKMSTVFELTDAIGRKDIEKALTILGKALSLKAIPFRKEEEPSRVGDPIPLLLSMMARQYRLIWRVKEIMARGQGAEEAARALKLSPWVVRNVNEQGRGFSEASLHEGILKCHRTDVSIKRGRGPKELLMEKLVIDLCRPGKA